MSDLKLVPELYCDNIEFMTACVDQLSVTTQSINDDGFHYVIALVKVFIFS
jgi:hypothetical protein